MDDTCLYCGKDTGSAGMIFHSDCGDTVSEARAYKEEPFINACCRLLREEKQQLWGQLWEMDCNHHYGRTLTGKKRHYCMDWDQLPLDETCDSVFPGCHCYDKDDDTAALKQACEARMDALEEQSHG